jgi:PHD/YefM family antitoxin component YafN of YafNO toxin-antitoxin module
MICFVQWNVNDYRGKDMATQTVTLQVDQAIAEVVRALMAKAEAAGKTITALFEELKETGQPLMLAVNGGEQIVLQDAAGYQKLLEELDRAESVAGIQRGLEAMEAGRTRPVKEFLAELREEFGFPESRPGKQ